MEMKEINDFPVDVRLELLATWLLQVANGHQIANDRALTNASIILKKASIDAGEAQRKINSLLSKEQPLDEWHLLEGNVILFPIGNRGKSIDDDMNGGAA